MPRRSTPPQPPYATAVRSSIRWRAGWLFVAIATAWLILACTKEKLVHVTATPPTSQAADRVARWAVESGAPAADLKAMEQAVTAVTSQHPLPLPAEEELSLEGLQVDGDWALVTGFIRHTATGELEAAEGFVVILQRERVRWQAAYPGTSEYERWLEQVPASLLSPEAKQFLR